jgi:hypothetical protein
VRIDTRILLIVEVTDMVLQPTTLLKTLLLVIGLQACAFASAGEGGPSGNVAERQAKVHVAAMNAAEDFATCFVYFKIVAVGMANSGRPDMEQSFEELAEMALAYAATYGEMGGLMPEAISASANLQIKEQMAMIGGNTSNIAILNEQYMELCKSAMQAPESRLKHWLERGSGIAP